MAVAEMTLIWVPVSTRKRRREELSVTYKRRLECRPVMFVAPNDWPESFPISSQVGCSSVLCLQTYRGTNRDQHLGAVCGIVVGRGAATATAIGAVRFGAAIAPAREWRLTLSTGQLLSGESQLRRLLLWTV